MSAPFKMKGSPFQRNFGIGSPMRDHQLNENGVVVSHEKDTRTEATKELDKTLDQIDRAKLYSATQSDKHTAETTGSRGRETIKTTVKIDENRKNRGETEKAYPSYGNTDIPTTIVRTMNPSYINEQTGKDVEVDAVPNETRTREFEKNKTTGLFGDTDGEETYTPGRGGGKHATLHGDITHNRSSVFDADSNTRTQTITSTGGYIAPKADMPVISLKPITPELKKPKIETPKGDQFVPTNKELQTGKYPTYKNKGKRNKTVLDAVKTHGDKGGSISKKPIGPFKMKGMRFKK